jgi:hypothetical protein
MPTTHATPSLPPPPGSYIVDLILHLDGAIEGKVEMTGYVQSVNYLPAVEPDLGRRWARVSMHWHTRRLGAAGG